MDSTWRVRTNASTLQSAKRHREIWTSSDLEFLESFKDEPIEVLARALGRTYAAVAAMKFLVLHGEHEVAERNRVIQARAAQHERLCGDCFTYHRAEVECY